MFVEPDLSTSWCRVHEPCQILQILTIKLNRGHRGAMEAVYFVDKERVAEGGPQPAFGICQALPRLRRRRDARPDTGCAHTATVLWQVLWQV